MRKIIINIPGLNIKEFKLSYIFTGSTVDDVLIATTIIYIIYNG
jgi:hypothetical protein